MFVGLLRYSLPFMNGMSRSNMKELQRVQAQALRVWLGLPCKIFNDGPVSEARVTSLSVLRAQETVRVHLRHISRLRNHHLVDVLETRPFCGYSGVLIILKDDLSNNFDASVASLIHMFPQWLYAPIPVKSFVPGINKKGTTPVNIPKQLKLEHIHASCFSSIHVFTDGPTTPTSAIGVYIPLADETIQRKLGHVTSSTSTELVAITEALRCILS